jgi:hypothetical protein
MPWDLVVDSNGDPRETSILVVHAGALPTGEVLFFGGSEHSFARFQEFKGGVSLLKSQRFRVSDGHLFNIDPSPNTDLFCCGHAFLGDGRLLAAGGSRDWPIAFYGDPPPAHAHAPPLFDQDPDDPNPHEVAGHWDGERACWVYQHWQHRWVRVRDMSFEAIEGMPQHQEGGGRWYPTLITLANGRVIAFAGHPSHEHHPHEHSNPEVYSAGKDAWEVDANRSIHFSYVYYPRGHLVPDGRIFFDSPVSGQGCGFYDHTTGDFEPVESLPQDKLDEGITEHFFTSVLLPLLPQNGYEPHVLASGWTGGAIRMHVGSGGWQDAGQRDWSGTPPARRNGCAVLLPTGEVVLVGGVDPTPVESDDGGTVLAERDSGGVLRAEVYTPPINWTTGAFNAAESWSTDSDGADVVRNYHSVALLLADGRVLTAGSNINASTGHPDEVAEKRLEIYRPWYAGQAGRPTLDDAPRGISYGDTFVVRSPDAGNIARAALLRLGSVTHAFDADQRYVGLQILDVSGSSLVLRAPPDGNVAPPGYYMLWIVNGAGLPCREARFVKLGHQGLFIVLNRSTISIHDVEAMLAVGQKVIPDAVQVVLQSVQPNDYVGPNVTLTLDSSGGDSAGGLDVSLQLPDVEYDIGQEHGDTAQRIVFSYALRITSTDVFDTFDEFRNLHIHAESDTMSGNAAILLHKQPNPFMLNGDDFWLSTDLRVFKVVEGHQAPFQPFPVIAAGFNPYAFLEETLQRFNTLAGGAGAHPFDSLSEDQERSMLELSRSIREGVGGPLFRVYNFAVARVRYRSVSTAAPDVGVFFRMFNTVGTALEFDEATTYRRAGEGTGATPLIGREGKVILSIPYFGSPRVDTTTRSMSEQDDPVNRRTLPATGGVESDTYFGCVLDFNQTEPRFPLYPQNDGPFGGELRSLQELTRGFHQCLVAQVHFGTDLIPARATPTTSDKLAQRNLWIDEGPNPGVSAESRIVMTTCELQGTRAQLSTSAGGGELDEVLVRWNNLPRGSRVTMYLPWENASEIVEAAADEHGAPSLRQVDEHTIEFTLGDVSFLPIPRGGERTVPGLLSIELPEGIHAGHVFRVAAHQYSDMGRPRGAPRTTIGSFEIDIHVKKSAEIVPGLVRRLSVLKHIVSTVPEDDRWYPILVRLVDGLGERLRGHGIDPHTVEPSPDGTGTAEPCDTPDVPGRQDTGARCYRGKICSVTYDCFGEFRGFVLDDCCTERSLGCRSKKLERVVLMAWREGVDVTVHVTERRAGLEVCINRVCPWSGEPVREEALASYRDHVVGFGNAESSGLFEQAVATFERCLRAESGPQVTQTLNAVCPWSGKSIARDGVTTYRGRRVGFCSAAHRDRFARAVQHFESELARAPACGKTREVVVCLQLHC